MMTAKVKYGPDPRKKIVKLTKSLEKRAIKRAITQAIPPVVAAVKAGAGKVRRFGFLEKSISKKVKGGKKAVFGVVGPLSKFRRRKGVIKRGDKKGQPIFHRPSYYMHLVDGGTKRSKKTPILKPALAQTKGAFKATLVAGIKREIAAELAKGK